MSDDRTIRENLEIVEEAYEFMLAYGAQGRTEEGAGPDGAHIRTFLDNFVTAADAMAPGIAALIDDAKADAKPLRECFMRDSDTVSAALRLLLSRDNISSEMVDNTNGMIVMRSYLTTLFFVDKVLLADGS